MAYPHSRRRQPAGFILPAQPTLVPKPPAGPEWIHEVKHDGYRLLALKSASRVVLRPELFRLIADSRPGDVLLVEQVDRLSRLTDGDWRKLRAELDTKQIRVVALDLPTSWMLAEEGDDFTRRMFGAVNAMMLDVLAAVARKDYEDRRRRQAEGQARAKAAGVYRGRQENVDRNKGIAAMLRSGESWSAVQAAFGCSRATVAKIAKR